MPKYTQDIVYDEQRRTVQNELLVLGQLYVEDKDLSSPPVRRPIASRYIVSDGAVNSQSVISFPGSGDFADVPLASPWSDWGNRDSWTIECWIKTNRKKQQWIAQLSDLSGSFIGLLLNSSGNLRMIVEGVNGNRHDIVGDGSYNDDTWYHIAFRRDGSENGTDAAQDIITNGTEENLTINSNDNIDDLDISTTFNIGSSESSGGSLVGRIDDFRLWDDFRTTNEIDGNNEQILDGNQDALSLYYPVNASSGSTITDEANSNDGTLKNNATFADDSDLILTGESSASGKWTGHATEIAVHEGNNEWFFLVPEEGWQAYVKDEDVMYKFDGSNWEKLKTEPESGSTNTKVVRKNSDLPNNPDKGDKIIDLRFETHWERWWNADKSRWEPSGQGRDIRWRDQDNNDFERGDLDPGLNVTNDTLELA